MRSIYESGVSDNVVAEMKRLRVDILGVSETYWPSNERCTKEDYLFSPTLKKNIIKHNCVPNIISSIKYIPPFSIRELYN